MSEYTPDKWVVIEIDYDGDKFRRSFLPGTVDGRVLIAGVYPPVSPR